MLNIINIVRHTEEKISKQIDSAVSTVKKAEEKNRVARRKSEAYFNVLVRASLGVAQSIEIDTYMQALCVAAPEFLFNGIFKLGYGESRHGKKASEDKEVPQLLRNYYKEFENETVLKEPVKLIESIKNGTIDKALLCHGLSACNDTILLLADIGRSVRISYALGLQDFEIMLADVSWIKHNRSLNRLYNSPKEFVDELRVCLDKRKRLYEVLSLQYKAFGISEKINNGCYISRKNLASKMSKWRDLANVIWGKDVLDAHSVEIKRAIGTTFDKIKLKNENKYLTDSFKMLLSVNNEVPKKLEEMLKSELSALRTISDLFSTFDEDIFMYYFAQYFAQSQYKNYLKIANISERKFDEPFSQKSSDFSALVGSSDDSTISVETNRDYQLYLPWYQLGKLKLLSYTSTSGDVLKNYNEKEIVDINKFSNSTILLDDYGNEKLEKIKEIIMETPIEHRNRLVSDILSFIRLLVKIDIPAQLKKYISELSEDIGNQMVSTENDIEASKTIYSNWLQSIGKNDAVMPFHLIPYFWEEEDWTENKITAFSNVISQTLELVYEICE